MPTSVFNQKRFKKVAITTGDPSGIGFEVTAKALAAFSKENSKPVLFFIFRNYQQEKKQGRYFKLIDQNWTRVTFFSLDLALIFSNSLTRKDLQNKKILIDLSLKSSAADWVFETARACSYKLLDSLVTAPLSKTLVKKSGYSQLGHTGIFRSLFPKHPMHMGFVGKDFNVLLVTDHIPLSKVATALNSKSIRAALISALILKKALASRKDIAVLGLNPHAGEAGLIGHNEQILFKRLPRGFVGPLVPDAAFLKKNWTRFCLFVCAYHDQGLIPFKMHHGQDSGVHVTLGLPFVRTSVDHGTAFDIFNKDLANSASMLEAIYFNLKLLENTKHV